MAIKGKVSAKFIVDPGLRYFFLNSLSPRQQNSTIMKAYRKSAKPLVQATKRNLKLRRKTKNTGSALFKAIGTKPVTKKTILLVGSRIYKGFTGYHGHLVNYGTKQRYRKTKKGRRVSTGRMPAMNFWSDALKSEGSRVGNSMTSNLEKSLIEWTKRKGMKS